MTKACLVCRDIAKLVNVKKCITKIPAAQGYLFHKLAYIPNLNEIGSLQRYCELSRNVYKNRYGLFPVLPKVLPYLSSVAGNHDMSSLQSLLSNCS